MTQRTQGETGQTARLTATRCSGWVAILLILLCLVAPSASAVEMFVTGIPNSGNQNWQGSLGDTFSVGSNPLHITSVGVFDDDQDGLNRQITFELWTGGAGVVGGRTELINQVFIIGSGTPDGNFRFIDLLLPLTLTAGQSYTVVAHGYGAGEQNYNENFAGPEVAFSSVGLTAGVGGFGAEASPGTDPDNFTWGPFTNGENFGVANFQYVVPEPSVLLLLGAGLLALAVWNRKSAA